MLEFGSGFNRLLTEATAFRPGALEAALGTSIVRRSVTAWAEHCSECAMPSCYASCAFYQPREDYKCRRFPGGVALLPRTEYSAAPMRLRFGKWARLMAYGPMTLHTVNRAVQKEARALWLAEKVSNITSLRGLVAPLVRRVTNAYNQPTTWDLQNSDRLYLVIEVVSSATESVALSLSCKVLDEPGAAAPIPPCEVVLRLTPGHNVKVLPVASFMSAQHFGRRFVMQLAPTNDQDHPELDFGFFDIAELDGAPRSEVLVARPAAVLPLPSPKIKCVLWDLDNTLWHGVLVEDGLAGLKLRQAAVLAIQELDRKGILQSVVSKNDHDIAMEALEHFGLADYFLSPQISWAPKSGAIQVIAQKLNIGSDTFAFIDDQEFERAEVATRHPEVLVIDSAALELLSTNQRFAVEVTFEAATRRVLYQDEENRKAVLEGSAMDYEDFLRSCAMRIHISPLDTTDLPRSYELAQRTNQLNIWSSRYTSDQLEALLADDSPLRAYTVRAEDRFGSYGLVGLCVVEESARLMRDLMFSCRIQGKLVGETFLAWLATRYPGTEPLQARFKQSPKNSPARKLLEAGGFVRLGALEEGERWVQSGSYRSLTDLDRIIKVNLSEQNPNAIGLDASPEVPSPRQAT